MAMSLDGKIATRGRDSKWITGDVARAHAHRLRTDQTLCLPASAPFSPTTLASQHGRLILGNDYAADPTFGLSSTAHGRMPVDASLLEEYGDVLQAVAVNGVSNRRSNVVAFPSDDKKAVDMAEVMRHLGRSRLP